jgi:outer membrane protein assembly factor BamB
MTAPRLTLNTLVAFLLVPAALAQLHWPQFRGPAGSGVAAGSAPVVWDGPSGRNTLWKREIPGLSHSSPVIWGDRIFLTTAVPTKGTPELKVGLYGDIGSVAAEGPHQFKVLCLDRKSGRTLWERTAIGRDPHTKRHPKSTHANPTPATDGRRLVVFFGSEGLYTYDLDGKLLWQKDLGTLDAAYFQAPTAQWGFASSPVIHEGKVLIQADVIDRQFLAAFDAETGKEQWRTPRTDVPTFATPAVAPYSGPGAVKHQVVVNGWKHIGGYDVATGKELWKLRGTGDIPVPTPVSADGLVIITNAHGGGRPIYAIRTSATGDITGDANAIAWSHPRSGNYIQTPLLHGGFAYFCFDNGVLTVYELETGNRVYSQRLGGGTSGFSSSPIAAGGHLYITDEEGKTYVLALGREYKLVRTNELGESVMATPAIAGGNLYIRGRQHLFAIGDR